MDLLTKLSVKQKDGSLIDIPLGVKAENVKINKNKTLKETLSKDYLKTTGGNIINGGSLNFLSNPPNSNNYYPLGGIYFQAIDDDDRTIISRIESNKTREIEELILIGGYPGGPDRNGSASYLKLQNNSIIAGFIDTMNGGEKSPIISLSDSNNIIIQGSLNNFYFFQDEENDSWAISSLGNNNILEGTIHVDSGDEDITLSSSYSNIKLYAEDDYDSEDGRSRIELNVNQDFGIIFQGYRFFPNTEDYIELGTSNYRFDYIYANRLNLEDDIKMNEGAIENVFTIEFKNNNSESQIYIDLEDSSLLYYNYLSPNTNKYKEEIILHTGNINEYIPKSKLIIKLDSLYHITAQNPYTRPLTMNNIDVKKYLAFQIIGKFKNSNVEVINNLWILTNEEKQKIIDENDNPILNGSNVKKIPFIGYDGYNNTSTQFHGIISIMLSVTSASSWGVKLDYEDGNLTSTHGIDITLYGIYKE